MFRDDGVERFWFVSGHVFHAVYRCTQESRDRYAKRSDSDNSRVARPSIGQSLIDTNSSHIS